MKIMFMGTPEISAGCLDALISAGHNVCAVVTGEDKPRGRGNVMTPTPTKALAQSKGIPVYTPKSLRTEEFYSLLTEIAPELICVVAYGKILPESVIKYPKYGCVNLHVSLLPKYRGAAPMQRAVMEGERETGVTVMYMDVGLDTGDIISVAKFPIGEEDDFETVHDTSLLIGSKLLSDTIFDIEAGKATRTPQNESLATYAKKVEKEDCRIDFSLDCKVVSARIRGVTPIPGAFTYHSGKMLKIFKVVSTEGRGKPGEVIEANGVGEGYITVACGSGAIKIFGVIPEGKGRMSAGDFVRGRKIAKGDLLG